MKNSIALYRKYRGLDFGDIVGQDHITKALTNAVNENRISHAYLLTGPHGVGKTSIARILAHKINGLEYTTEDNHLDIVEIDAASNRRIDEIRDLREKAQIAPVSAKYKVYIIDEVHMLTKEAFNALLKTLEEPPAHVVFILATTELHKLPQTIISRTQRYTFKPISRTDAVSHLRHIAKIEKIKINDGALQIIADHGNGSFRDAISLIDQIRGLGQTDVDEAAVESMLGLARQPEIEALLQAVKSHEVTTTLKLFEGLVDTGIQPELLCKQLVDTVRSSPDYLTQLTLIEKLIEVPKSSSPLLRLELVLLDAASSGQQEKVTTDTVKATGQTLKTANKPKLDTSSLPKGSEQNSAQPETTKTMQSDSAPKSENQLPDRPINPKSEIDQEDWNKILSEVKTANNPIASILRNSEYTLSDGKLSIGPKFKFHLKKLESVEVKEIIATAAESVLGVKPEIEPYLGSTNKETINKSINTETPEDAADKIISTFGGGERVEL